MIFESAARTHYSFLRGASSPDEMVSTAARLGYRGIAICDRNGVYGLPKAFAAAKRERDFRLISAAEFTLFDHPPIRVLAKTKLGYQSIVQALTASHSAGSKGEEGLHLRDWLSLFDGVESDVHVLIKETTTETLQEMKRRFSQSLSLLITPHITRRENDLRRRQVERSRALDIPLLASAECDFHIPERRPLYDILSCIREGTTLQSARGILSENSASHLVPIEQMARLFQKEQRALRRAEQIFDECRFCLSELRYQYPSEWIPPEETADSYLENLVWKGALQRYSGGVPKNVEIQLRRELSLIRDLRFADYFLTIWDIVQFAKSKDILCQGRGSAANSAICFVLGITEVDPTKMGLLFERFMSAERGEPPDIDVDFENGRREEVIQEIYRKYGRDRAAMVSAVVTFQKRLALREVAKVFGIEELQDATTELQEQIHRYANELKGFPRHLSIHSGGFVLSGDPLTGVVPIEPARMEGRTIVQWDKYDLDIVGLLKVDILALGMLSALQRMLKSTGYQTLFSLPPEDTATYQMIQRAETVGVFQIESRAQMSMLPRLKPKCFYDLVIEVAIVRPGPIVGQMVHPYLKRRRGLEAIEYPHPKLRNILEKTLGVPLFQEQVMRIAIELAGFSPGEADHLRRAIGAWRSSGEIETLGKRLMEGLLKNGLPKEFAERVFLQIQGFAQYGFPESHAASFALLVYASAYFKCHHPAEFTAALLNSQPMGFYSKQTLIHEVKRQGVVVTEVDVHRSSWETQVMGSGAILLGFHVIRGISGDECETLLEERKKSAFQSLSDYLKRVRIRWPVQEQLALANAFRGFGLSEREVLWEMLRHRFWYETETTGGQLSLWQHVDTVSTHDHQLRHMEPEEQLVAHYHAFGASVRRHPMEILRTKIGASLQKRLREVRCAKTGSRVDVVGLLIVRQRPSTAKGTCFGTLEDETGFLDLIVRKATYERARTLFNESLFVRIQGRLQKDGDAVSVVVDQVLPLQILPSRLDEIPVRRHDWR